VGFERWEPTEANDVIDVVIMKFAVQKHELVHSPLRVFEEQALEDHRFLSCPTCQWGQKRHLYGRIFM
jgi:hypothetical protein